MKKRVFAFFLCFAVMLSSITVFAAEESGKATQSIEILDFGTKIYGDECFKVEVREDANSALTDFAYASSNTDVAEIAPDGTVTIKGAGETIITVKQAGNDSYAATEASRTLTVNKKDVILSSVDFDNRSSELIGILEEDAEDVRLDFDNIQLDVMGEGNPEDLEDIFVQQGCMSLRGVVIENTYTEIYGEKAIDTTDEPYVSIAIEEIYNSKGYIPSYGDVYTFLVGETNAEDFLGKSVNVYATESGDDFEILSISEDTERNDILAIPVDQVSKISSDGYFEYYETPTSTKTTSVRLDDDVAVVYNNVGGFWVDDVFDWINEANGQLTLIDNNDVKGYDVIFAELAETAVVDEAEKGYVTFKDYTHLNGISELEFDASDRDKLVKVTKNGKEIALEELQEWDVLSIYAAWDDADYICAEVVSNQVVGVITGESQSYASATGYAYKIGDRFYDVAPGAYGVNGIYVGDGGTFYIDKYGKIAAFKEDLELATGVIMNYAYVTAVAFDEDILSGEDIALMQLVTENGIEVLTLKSKGAKIDGMTVTSSSHAVINAVANKMIKYSTNSSGEIVEIKTLDNDDTVIGGISEERINAEYDAENSRFYGQFFMDADSYVFFIDPYDAEESYLGTLSDLTDGEFYDILGKYADNKANDYNIVLILEDVEIPEIPDNETDAGYAFVTAVALDEDILTGKNIALLQLVTEDGVEVLGLKEKRAKLNGETIDFVTMNIESLCETYIKYSVNSAGDISSIITPDADENLSGDTYFANVQYNSDTLSFGIKDNFAIDADAKIYFVDPFETDESYVGCVSDLTNGEYYELLGRYTAGSSSNYNIIIISYDVEVPETPDNETYGGYALVSAVAFDEDILSGKEIALVQLVTANGTELLKLKSRNVIIDGMQLIVDNAPEAVEAIAGKIISFSKNSKGEVSKITTLDYDETIDGGMLPSIVDSEYSAVESRFVTGEKIYLDSDAVVFFADESDLEESKMGTASDLIDGVDYTIFGYYADEKADDYNILIVRKTEGVVSKKAGLSVITAVGMSENEDGEEIFNIEALSNGETIIADTTNDVFWNVEQCLTVGDIVKMQIDKNGIVSGMCIVFDFSEEVRYNHGWEIPEFAMEFDMGYVPHGLETIVGGKVSFYRNASTLATIDGEEVKLSRADNVYVIDTNGRSIEIKKGSSSNFKYFEDLYDESIAYVDVTIDGEPIAEGAERTEAQQVADYVFARMYDGITKEVVIVKGPENVKIRGYNNYALNAMSVSENENSAALSATSGTTMIACATNLSLTGEKADNYNLTVDELYVAVNESNLAALSVDAECGTVTGAESGTYVKNSELTLTAVPDIGYTFKGWYKDGRCVCVTEEYTFVLSEDTELWAEFEYFEGLLNCGKDANGNPWYLYDSGILEIEGDGMMEDYAAKATIPWYESRTDITEITIADGITHIGKRSFYGCINAQKVTIPETVTSIGDEAFANCDEITIYGVLGSYAETYAKANGIPFAEYIEMKKLGTITVDMTENTLKWYFDISLKGFSEPANVYVAIYNQEGRMLAITSDILATGDITTLFVDKHDDAAYAKIHILDENLDFEAISKRIDF
ncbi:MAG: leucine-rich repeat domain-containing protein [Clostridia bacterium]|nr:leucine-rich repeat domain-containing protein [Clostridia bacterium]